METQPSLSVDRVTAPQAAEPAPPRVIDRLAHFRVIRNHWIQAALDYLPLLTGFLLLIDWLVGTSSYTRDPFLLTAALCITLELLLLRSLFAQVPEALLSLWTRHLFAPGGPELEQAFLDYLDRFERLLNSRIGWVISGVLSLMGVALTYPIQMLFRTGIMPLSGANLLSYYLLSRPVYIYILLYSILGLMAWRAAGIALYLDRLGKRFEIKIMPNHPDNCGGLKPLGNLCLMIALLLLVPAIYFAIWASIDALTGHNPHYAIYIQLWAPAFRQILAVLSILAVFAFFLPVYSIHQEMKRCQRAIQEDLDKLSQEIDRTLLELRTQSSTLTPQQGSQKLEMLAFLQKVYQAQTQIPTWPFDWKLLARFASAQALPVLTLLGTSKPVIELITSLFGSIGK